MLLSPHLATPLGKVVTLQQGLEDVFAPTNGTKWVNTAVTERGAHEGDVVVSANPFLFTPP